MSNLKFTNDELELVHVAANAILRVINKYINFIAEISSSMDTNLSEEENSKVRKFSAIKKELYIFLNKHKKIYKLDKVAVESKDGLVLYEQDIGIVDEGLSSLTKDVALNISELCGDDLNLSSKVIFRNSKILRTLRKKIGKSSITVGDVEKFLESNYLFDNKNFDIKKSNYKDLRAYIDQRVIDYCDLKISTEIIKYM